MKIHHLSCGTMCPFGGHLMDGVTPGFGPSHLVCHCLLIEDNNQLILVDTGFGTREMQNPTKQMGLFFRTLNRPQKNLAETAKSQIIALGYNPRDVQHILLTHLDFDHAGGIADFPEAQVHIFNNEYQTALQKKGFINSRRYNIEQWLDHKNWLRYKVQGDPWFGFEAVHGLRGVSADILLIPLVGHTMGHCGIAVKNDNKWLLLAGDAYFNWQEMNYENPRCPKGAAAYQTMMEMDRSYRLQNQSRLRKLIKNHPDEVTVFCSHDPTELENLRQLSPRAPFERPYHPEPELHP